MKAMVFEKVGMPLVLRDTPVPIPGEGQIRVRVEACAVCRTDLHIFDGDLPNPKLPLIPGHEIVGIAEEVGPGDVLVTAGAAAFLAAWPLVTASGLLWRFFLEAAGVALERQPMIDLFSRANSPGVIALMITLAVVIAPVTEELVFRGGLFRYVRGRVSRTFAIMGPAVIFGAFHTNLASLVPLIVLAIVLSHAYERTGHIGTPIVAHALFNLNTVVLIYSGVGDLT